MFDGDPQVLYRIYEGRRGRLLLYIGITNSLPRRVAEHQADKDWFPETGRIAFETYPDRKAVSAAEKKAIRSERPRHNVTHNPLRIEAGVAAEVELTGIGVMVMGAAGLVMLGKWAGDALATWRVRNLAAREGREIELPRVRNPFMQEPPSFLQKVFYGSMFLACTPPPPVVIPGNSKSYETLDAWREKNEQLFAAFMATQVIAADVFDFLAAQRGTADEPNPTPTDPLERGRTSPDSRNHPCQARGKWTGRPSSPQSVSRAVTEISDQFA